jgi:hypothetical protein
MKNSLYLKLFVACFPIFVVVSIYLVTDPFKVLYHYDTLIGNGKNGAYLNKDYISTETFVRNYPAYNYDSYIFGSSRSRYYKISEWKKHISGNSFFHFDAYNESLFGIERKISFLHNKGVRIRNAIIFLDEESLAITENHKGHLYRKHPLTSGEATTDFQLANFKDFLDVSFLGSYVSFLITGKAGGSAIRNGYIDTTSSITYNAINNEIDFTREDQEIDANPDAYYKCKAGYFYNRSPVQQVYSPILMDAQRKMLANIKKILAEDSTNYRIVINPLYNQKKLNSKDAEFLASLFGKPNFFDFSGKNAITDDPHNYYESSHYRVHVANEILNAIY